MARLAPALATGCFPALLAACGADESAPRATAAVVERDSAGIRIVETAAPAWEEPGAGWRVTAEPTLQIGVVEGPTEYMFDRIMGAVRFADGTIAVGTMGSGSIRYYDAEGTFLREAGRPGEGPGEFRQLMGVQHLSGDTLMADNAREEALFFDIAGNHVRTVSAGLLATEWGYAFPIGWLADGTVIAATSPQSPPEGSTGAVADSGNLMLWEGTGYGPPVVRLPMRVWSDGPDPRRLPQQFGPGVALATHQNSLFFSFASHPNVHVFTPAEEAETGTRTLHLERILRRLAWSPEPVTQDAIDAFTHQYVNEATGEDGQPNPRMEQLRRSNLERMSFAEHFPAHRRMLVDRSGGVWLQHYVQMPTASAWNQTLSEPTVWDAYTPAGAWMGPVELPADFHPFEIGDDYVLGLWRDDMDVEYVRMYGLEKV